MSKKSRSHRWRGQTTTQKITCTVIAANGKRIETAPQWFNVQVRYRRLIQLSPLRAKVAPGYDVHTDAETGALRLYDIANDIGYPIPSQWRQVERQFMLDPSGRSVGVAEREQAINEDCLFSDWPAIVIKREFIGGELKAA